MTTEKDEKSKVYKFADCVVDADRRELTRAGDAVTMQPKAFELLLYLIRNRHRAVEKDELQDVLWPRSIVTETALTRCVMKARRAVGDDADKQAVIKTVHGHGYHFTAEIEDSEEQAAAVSPPEYHQPLAPRHLNLQPFKIIGATAGLFAVIVFVWLYFSPPALSGPVRLAVLPVENATGDADMDWVSSGLMALMGRMLQDKGIETVSSRDVSGLAGDTPLAELIATGSEFRGKLARTAAATHVVGARLEDNNGLYRLTYTLAGVEKRPTRRTIVGKEPTKLVKDVVDTVAALIVQGPPVSSDQSSVSNDEFLNEAYARAMSLYHEGRYEDAKGLFEVIIEQEPHLFWPRYERALAIRNLRDFETAERELITLRDETSVAGLEKERAGVENALGIMYMGKRRNDEARAAFDKTVELAVQIDDKMRTATGYQNLGLLEKSLGNLALAFENMQKSEQVYTDMDIRTLPGTMHNNMSGVLIQMGDLQKAEQRSHAAIESFRLTGNRLYESYALNRLSTIYTHLRLFDDAEDAAERSLSVRRELNDTHGIASSIINLAQIAFSRGDLTRAMQYAGEAYDMGNDIESATIIVAALFRIARSEVALDKLQEAAAHYAEIESIARSGDDRVNVFAAQLGTADAWTAMGDFDGALAIGNELLTQTRENNRRREETGALRVFAGVYMAQENYEDAIEVLQEVHTIATEIGDDGVRVSTDIDLADAYLSLGNTDAARAHVEAAAAERPKEAASLKVQAKLAAMHGNDQEAARLMGLARINAGENWGNGDKEQLASYREVAGVSAE